MSPDEIDYSIISFEKMNNILCDFSINEFMHAKTPLFITKKMTTLYEKLHKHKRLLQGPSGVGKTTTLLYIGHMARAKGYVVFPIQACDFVNQAEPMSNLIQQYLRRWFLAGGEDIAKDIFGDDFGKIKTVVSATILPH